MESCDLLQCIITSVGDPVGTSHSESSDVLLSQLDRFFTQNLFLVVACVF